MKDASGHEHDDLGRFTGDGVTSADELKKKPVEELAKINPWDDEKTRKMKMRLAKMHSDNQAIRDDIAKRKAHIEQMKKEIGRGGKASARSVMAAFAACTAHREDNGARWFQTFPPYGRYPVDGTVRGAREDAEFVIDEAATKSILDDFASKKTRADWPGILVDREHFSADPEKGSDAMAWATDIRQEADGSIWTRWEFTPEGERLWNGKVLVSRSPFFRCAVHAGGREYHPVALESIAMTNTPHFKELSTLAAAREAAEVNTQKGDKMDKDILAALGLAEDAGKDEVLAAIRAMRERTSAAEASASDAEKERDKAVAECRSMKADAFIEANKAKIADAAACRKAYLENPELAEAMVAACKAPAAQTKQQVLAAATAKTPEKATDSAVAAARQAKVNEYMAGHPGTPFHVAWSACRQAYPEVFNG